MVDLATFRSKVIEYRKMGSPYEDNEEASLENLAREINLDPRELHKRFNGLVSFNHNEVRAIVRVLVEWGSISTKQQAQELLALMDCPGFTPGEWAADLLVVLEDKPSFPIQATISSFPVPDNATSIGNMEGSLANISSNLNNVTQIINHNLLKPRRPCPVPPPAPDHFGGRDKELDELKDQLKAGESIVLTAVKGLGGIGKTTIARQLASDLYNNKKERIFSAVFWKEIKRKPEQLKLLLDWAYQADPTFIYNNQSSEQLVGQVKALLEELVRENCEECYPGPNRVLVVFDDVWDDGIEAVRFLRQACPDGATVLITTRSGKVASLLSGKTVQLDKLKPEKGVELLKTYLPKVDPNLLIQLTKVLDGHALALTIAARRVLMESDNVEKQNTALKEHIQQYDEGLPSGTSFGELELELGDDKEDNLSKALYYSYEELDTQEQKYFRALGILPYNAPFDEMMLSAVWDLELNKLKKPCKRLRLLSLIDEDEVTSKTYDGTWFRQHPVVQSYARALLKNA